MFRIIIKDYCKEHSIIEIIVELIFAISIAILLAYIFPNITNTFISTLIAAYSIFVGFLFNLIIMLSNMAKDIKIEQNEPKSRSKLKLVKLKVIEKCLKIISGSILIAVCNIILMLFHILDFNTINFHIQRHFMISEILMVIFSGITYLFTILFIISLYSILKITHILLQKEVEIKDKELNQID